MPRKATAKDQPSLLPDTEAPAMKDVTPKSADKNKAGGGHQAKEAKPAPKKPPSGGSSGKRPSTAVSTVKAALPSLQAAKSVLEIIADAAARSDFNPDNMRQLLDMQKEIMAEQSRRDFAAAFVSLQAELPVINARGRIEVRAKDGSGERTGRVQQSTPYAKFNDIMDAIQPLLTKHGFGLSFETQPSADGTRLLVTGTLEFSGHQRQTVFPLPAEVSGSKNNVQGWGSSMSYGKRYCTIALLNIRSAAPEDRDTDGYHVGNLQQGKDGALVQPDKVEVVSAAHARDLRDAMDDAGVSTENFCRHYGIKGVVELPASLFQAAMKELQEYREKKRNG